MLALDIGPALAGDLVPPLSRPLMVREGGAFRRDYMVMGGTLDPSPMTVDMYSQIATFSTEIVNIHARYTFARVP